MKFAEVLEKMGATVEWTEHSVTVTGAPVDPATGKRLRGIDVDMNSMPDVAMTLAVMGLFSGGPVAIRDGMLQTCFTPLCSRKTEMCPLYIGPSAWTNLQDCFWL